MAKISGSYTIQKKNLSSLKNNVLGKVSFTVGDAQYDGIEIGANMLKGITSGNITNDTRFTITTADSNTSVESSVNVDFGYGVWRWTSDNSNYQTIPSSASKGLYNPTPSSISSLSWTVSGTSQYLYFAVPTAWATSAVFQTSLGNMDAVTVTTSASPPSNYGNSSGYSTYSVFRTSEKQSPGSYTLNVSLKNKKGEMYG